MRNLIVGIIFINITKLCFSQGPFAWPVDLQINPNEYALTKLGIKEIIQYKKYNVEGKFLDSTNRQPTYLNYIISYDSLHRISSFKYDFLNHLNYSKFYGDSIALDSLRNIAIAKNLPIHFLKLDNVWIAKSYWEVIFSYNSYGVSRLEILNPYQRLGTAGVLDGVYVQKRLHDEILIKNYYNEFGELIRIEAISQDSLIWQKSYKYETFKRNGYEERLLTQSIVDGYLYTVEYTFED